MRLPDGRSCPLTSDGKGGRDAPIWVRASPSGLFMTDQRESELSLIESPSEKKMRNLRLGRENKISVSRRFKRRVLAEDFARIGYRELWWARLSWTENKETLLVVGEEERPGENIDGKKNQQGC